MNVAKFNELCKFWHHNKTGLRLGQFLMNNLETPTSDPEIYNCSDKKQAATLFFERHVKVSDNSPYRAPPVNEL